MKKIIASAFILVIISFIIGIISFQYLPDAIASHWNSSGEVNGYMPKLLGLFLMPIISLAMLLLFIFLPRLDPMKKNYEKFKNYYNSFILVLILFLFYIYLLTIFWNLGIVFNMNLAFIPAIGFLFIYIGILLKHTKRNWFLGIRTPWSLSSDLVWQKTHDLGSILFIVSGIISIIGIFFQNYIVWFILVPIIASAVITYVYSYFIWKKEKKN